MANIQSQLEQLIKKNYYLNMSAKDGFKSYVRAYESHSLKHIFDVQTLNLAAVGKSFGFETPPHIDLGVGVSKKFKKNRNNDYFKGGSGKKDQKSKIYKPGKFKGKKYVS